MKHLYKQERRHGTGKYINRFLIYYKSCISNSSNTSSAIIAIHCTFKKHWQFFCLNSKYGLIFTGNIEIKILANTFRAMLFLKISVARIRKLRV